MQIYFFEFVYKSKERKEKKMAENLNGKREAERKEIVSLVGGKAHGVRALPVSSGDINNRFLTLKLFSKPETLPLPI